MIDNCFKLGPILTLVDLIFYMFKTLKCPVNLSNSMYLNKNEVTRNVFLDVNFLKLQVLMRTNTQLYFYNYLVRNIVNLFTLIFNIKYS